MYDFDFRVFAPHVAAFANGLVTTLLLAFGASAVGTLTGVPIGAALRVRSLGWLRIVNDAIRAIPVLVLMFLAYYLPYTDFGLRPVSPCGGTFLGLVIAQAVYTADLFRATVDGMSAQTQLAARALGMKRYDIWRFVVFPDVFRTMFPTLVAFTIGNIHLSALGASVGCKEVMWVALTAGDKTKRSFEGYVIVAVIYAFVVVTFAFVARRLERGKWLRRHG